VSEQRLQEHLTTAHGSVLFNFVARDGKVIVSSHLPNSFNACEQGSVAGQLSGEKTEKATGLHPVE
jgi:hypothetical protein